MIKKEMFCLRGLVKCLRDFDEDGRYARSGNWSIGQGGYDLNWELYYDNKPIIDCVGRNIEVCTTDGKCNINQVLKRIRLEYPDCIYRENED